MNRPPIYSQRGFADNFGKGRVRMAGARKIFAACAESHRGHSFGYQLAGARSDNMHTQDSIRLLVSQDLHAPIELSQ